MKLRGLLQVVGLVGVVALGGACAVAPTDDADTSADAVTKIKEAPVRTQSIGNCWLYATTGWAAALANKAAPSTSWEFSPAYLSYWYWYDQLTTEGFLADATNGWIGGFSDIVEGGWWKVAADLVSRRGLVKRGVFVANDETAATAALATIRAAVKTGGSLGTRAQRQDHVHVRRVLDAAWGVSHNTTVRLDAVFGANGETSVEDSNLQNPDILAPSKVPAYLSDGDGNVSLRTIADAVNPGPYQWTVREYPGPHTGRRDFVRSVQKSLHMGAPVPVVWFVDFAALGADGAVRAAPSQPKGGGLHMTLIDDYQVTNVPGFGTLPAGVFERRPQARDAALSDQATVQFFRIKNSWGLFTAPRAGYNDLYMPYLDGPVKKCSQKANGEINLSDCETGPGLIQVVLPAGV